MIPNRQEDPIGYARFWMSDLFPVLQERAAKKRLFLQTRDLSDSTPDQALKRLNRLVDRQLLRRYLEQENGSYAFVFVPVEFLEKHFLSGVERITAPAPARARTKRKSEKQPKQKSINGKKIWIESDLLGAMHVMVQNDMHGEKPFCYASFHYDWLHTCNSATTAAAEQVARQLGAKAPIEYRCRPAPQTDTHIDDPHPARFGLDNGRTNS